MPPRPGKGIPRRPEFNRALLAWYRRHGRTLPWRNIRDPYRILLSEIMLQQTQANRVLEKYPLFLKRFPTITRLARARQRSVLLAWWGMGYNNRAVRLHRLAKAVVAEHDGRLPSRLEDLLVLPGIGPYTAHAILASIHHRAVPAIDVNVSRVLSRVFWRMKSTEQHEDQAKVWGLAANLISRRKPYDWNQALMDLGATICIARKPICSVCPVSRLCTSSFRMNPSRRQGPRREPSLRGVPNRILRGRIVQELRTRRAIRLEKLQESVASHGSRKWWRGILSGLERDGLIKVRGRDPSAPTHIELA